MNTLAVKRLIVLGLLLMPILFGCKKKDPETEDLKKYVQQELFQIRTNLRAATSQYEKSLSKNELARSGIIKGKVLFQYRKYLDGLKAIKANTAYVQAMNDEGIKHVNNAIDSLEKYRKAMVKRDSQLTMRARMDAEHAMQDVENWQKEIWENARARGLSVPADIN